MIPRLVSQVAPKTTSDLVTTVPTELTKNSQKKNRARSAARFETPRFEVRLRNPRNLRFFALPDLFGR